MRMHITAFRTELCGKAIYGREEYQLNADRAVLCSTLGYAKVPANGQWFRTTPAILYVSRHSMISSARTSEGVPLLRSSTRLNSLQVAGIVLLLSGGLHLLRYAVLGGSWEGPLSIRKPILFGLSAGVTALSLAWVQSKLRPWHWERRAYELVAISLVCEVALITLQYWRGAASHFNRATPLDATIDIAMLGLIAIVTLGIAWQTFRTLSGPLDTSPAQTSAIRGGLVLLLLSCAIGFVISFLGEMNVANGRTPEHWGFRGVLKYPHGACLHAIQTLPMAAWAFDRLGLPTGKNLVRCLIGSHVFFLAHAVWQTSHGLDRMELDAVSLALLLVAFALAAWPAMVATYWLVSKFRNPIRREPLPQSVK